jgi:hypothetical protein
VGGEFIITLRLASGTDRGNGGRHGRAALQDLAKTYNPYIEGWINYYGQFYRTQLRSTLKRIDVYVIRWARRKFKRLRHQTKGARWSCRCEYCASSANRLGLDM